MDVYGVVGVLDLFMVNMVLVCDTGQTEQN